MTEPRAPGDKAIYQRIARAGEAIDPGLSDRDVERLVAGVGRRRARRSLQRVVLGAVAGAGLTAAALLLLRPAAPPGPTAAAAPGAAAQVAGARGARAVRLADGSVATPADERSALAVVEDAPGRIALELERGRARFEVVPAAPARPFVVRAGDVTITVLGTVFSVERVADRIGVSVEKGTVLVDWGLGHRTLAAAESGWFPPLVVGTAATPETAAAAAAPEAAPVPLPARARAPHATPSLRPQPPVATPQPQAETSPPAPARRAAPRAETAESLLAAADAARLAGHPGDGAELLRRVVREHRADPRAPLAAFTLGRLLLMELGRPREAAAAFADARALAPAGPFAEDALAREAEAWAMAGDQGEARARARDYLRRYPGGRRAPMLKALGGGE